MRGGKVSILRTNLRSIAKWYSRLERALFAVGSFLLASDCHCMRTRAMAGSARLRA